jgi:hypothetical protein
LGGLNTVKTGSHELGSGDVGSPFDLAHEALAGAALTGSAEVYIIGDLLAMDWTTGSASHSLKFEIGWMLNFKHDQQ